MQHDHLQDEDLINTNSLTFFNRTDVKLFNILGLNFWSSDQIISRNFNFKTNFYIQSIKNSSNEEEATQFKTQKDKIEYSYQVLSNLKSKNAYLHFLFLNYVFSQPNSLEKLKNNYPFCVFPFFIFVIEFNYESNIPIGSSSYIVIDFVRLVVNFYNKEKLEKGINGDDIKEVKCERDKIVIRVLNSDSEISFEPQLQQQKHLIYVLINMLMRQSVKIKQETSEIKNPETSQVDIKNFIMSDIKLLTDESYLPNGIILKSFIYKQHKKMTIGTSLRNEFMSHICNVIPIMHCNILFHFEEENLKMKIKLSKRKYVVYFKVLEELQIWRTTINGFADSRIDEKFEEDFLSNFVNTHFRNISNSDDTDESKDFLLYLENKISSAEKKLKDLIDKRDFIVNMKKEKRNSLVKPLEDMMNSDNFEDAQENYHSHRLKRMSSKR